MTVFTLVGCEPSTSVVDENLSDKTQSPQTANRRSIGEYHGLYPDTTYSHGHYAPAASTSYHGHYHIPVAPHYHAHSYAADHYHGYAPAHYHGHYYHTGNAALVHQHVYKHHHPAVVHQSVQVHTYPTATTVVHKPVPVPVAHPVPVPVDRPVAVEVPRPYPVPVNRPYPVTVIKPVPVPVAQPYPVTVYRPYPVPVYRPLPVATVARPVVVRPAVRLPTTRVVPLVRYPSSYPYHLHHAYAPAHQHAYAVPAHHHAYAAPAHRHVYSTPVHQHYNTAEASYPASAASYLQQLAAVRAAAGTTGAYEVNEPVAAQQQPFPDEFPFLQNGQDATDIHHHHDNAIDQDGDYPSLTAADETLKNSLGVPSTDYTGKKK